MDKVPNLLSSCECCCFPPFCSHHHPTCTPGIWLYLLLSKPTSLSQAFNALSKLLFLSEGSSSPLPSSIWNLLMIFKNKCKSQAFSKIFDVYRMDFIVLSSYPSYPQTVGLFIPRPSHVRFSLYYLIHTKPL